MNHSAHFEGTKWFLPCYPRYRSKCACMLRLAVATILNAKHDQFTCLMAIVCSSWTTINMGTSGRHVAHPAGREELEYVANANKMAARSFSIIRIICFLYLMAGVIWSFGGLAIYQLSIKPMPYEAISSTRHQYRPSWGWHFWSLWSRQCADAGLLSSRPCRCCGSIHGSWMFSATSKKLDKSYFRRNHSPTKICFKHGSALINLVIVDWFSACMWIRSVTKKQFSTLNISKLACAGVIHQK